MASSRSTRLWPQVTAPRAAPIFSNPGCLISPPGVLHTFKKLKKQIMIPEPCFYDLGVVEAHADLHATGGPHGWLVVGAGSRNSITTLALAPPSPPSEPLDTLQLEISMGQAPSKIRPEVYIGMNFVVSKNNFLKIETSEI